MQERRELENARGYKRTLHEIIEVLENPPVRLPDNSAYRLDREALGILSAYAVSRADVSHSPGRLLLAANHNLHPDALAGVKKEFQRHLRSFLYARAGELVWRASTREEMKHKYLPGSFPDFAAESVEQLVKQGAEQTHFSRIGEAVRRGAEEYEQQRRQSGMRNYRLSAEYNTLLRELKKE